MQLTQTQIAQRLANALDPSLPPENPYPQGLQTAPPTPAAVLIPLFCTEQGWHVLLIRRSLHPQDRHGGQVAFPGGRCDPNDPDIENAALREAHEEVGLRPQDIQILGRLRDMLTITNYRVTPIVGVMPWPYDVRPQPEEVSRIFSIPLVWLADPTNRYAQVRQIQQQGNSIPVIYFSDYAGEMLWGASARMMVLLLEALGLATPERRYA
ncbi:MAG: CoA pyrophosphatase [Anaerolineae bacterium]|nr:CoA pyrophosphatase [Anaerolineae bacterium]MBL6965541.1 CoA pyrophosphatase [Anaerolineales bacterium]